MTISGILEGLLDYDLVGHSIEDIDHEIIDGLVDIYNHDLLSWLSSNLLRASYCDDAQESGLVTEETQLYQRISAGQYLEISEIMNNIIVELENLEEIKEEVKEKSQPMFMKPLIFGE